VKTRVVLLAGAFGLAASLQAAAQLAPPSPEHFAFAVLDNGTSVGFALLRTGHAEDVGQAMTEDVLPRSNTVSRVVLDAATGSYAGYRLEVSNEKDGRFKVAIKQLPSSVERELRKRPSCSSCSALHFLGPSGSFTRVIDDDGVFTLDLLVNPATGAKILDVVKVSRRTLGKQDMREAAARILDFLKAVKNADYRSARREYPLAVVFYERALKIHPNDIHVRNRLAMCLQRSGRFRDADKEYDRALAIDPRYAEAWNNKGTLAHSRDDFRTAVRYYKKAIAINPDLAPAYKNLGTAYFCLKRFEDGFEAYQAAYRLDPSILEAPTAFTAEASGADAALQSFYFAKISAASGQVDAALKFLRHAFEKGFRDFHRVRRDPDLQPVVKDPRYEVLQKEFSRDR